MKKIPHNIRKSMERHIPSGYTCYKDVSVEKSDTHVFVMHNIRCIYFQKVKGYGGYRAKCLFLNEVDKYGPMWDGIKICGVNNSSEERMGQHELQWKMLDEILEESADENICL